MSARPAPSRVIAKPRFDRTKPFLTSALQKSIGAVRGAYEDMLQEAYEMQLYPFDRAAVSIKEIVEYFTALKRRITERQVRGWLELEAVAGRNTGTYFHGVTSSRYGRTSRGSLDDHRLPETDGRASSESRCLMKGSATGNTHYMVAASADFRLSDGREAYPGFDFTPVSGRSDIQFRFLQPSKVVGASQTRDLDALILSSGKICPESLASPARLALIVQFGAGVDHIDIDACTRAAIAVVNTAGAVRRPVAVAILTLILALAGRLREKDRLARSGSPGWTQAAGLSGVGLRGKTLGSVGLGGIATELFRLARPLDLDFIAHDPAVDSATAARLGVRWVELDEVFRLSDIVTVNCPLTAATRHLVNAKRLALMKSSAFLINTARGGVIDQRALTAALASGRIAGAGIDVFEQEPADADDPLFKLDNVVVTPHCLCWTDELYRASGEEAVAAVTKVLAGKMPQRLLNPAVAKDERWLAKLAALAAKGRP